MDNYICIDIDFSTTRMVLEKKPVVQKSSDDYFQTCLFLEFSNPNLGEGGLRTQGYFKKNTIQKPLVTIVTVVFNGENFLEETIKSVISQGYDNVEYIIIDGASTDGTIDVIKKYEQFIDYWVSEEDKGIYDAMNKGISLATGQLINFLNAGDRLTADSISAVVGVCDDSCSMIVGEVAYDSGRVFKPLSHRMVKKNAIHHQGAFYPLNLFKRFGVYSLEYKVLADYHHNYKLIKAGIPIVKLDKILAICSVGGVSDIPRWGNYSEEINIRCLLLDNKWKCILWSLYSIARFVGKKVFR